MIRKDLHPFTGLYVSTALLCALGLSLCACGSSKDSSNSDSGSGASANDGNDGSGASGGSTPDGTGAGGSSQSGSGASAGSTSSDGAQGGSADGSDEPTFECTTTAEPAELVAVAAGDFVMGCEGDDCEDDEKPLHTVTLSAFEIDETEVTQAQYTACVLDGACEPPSCTWDCDAGTLPASCVTWVQASAYCSWADKRLPTEAEWEKAARGDQGNTFPWGDEAPDCTRANMEGCGGAAQPVASLSAGVSPYGAYDMAGNVVEFVSDYYDVEYYASSPAEDPTGPASGDRIGGRGGGFKSSPEWMRGAKRDWYQKSDAAPSLGFRCAR